MGLTEVNHVIPNKTGTNKSCTTLNSYENVRSLPKLNVTLHTRELSTLIPVANRTSMGSASITVKPAYYSTCDAMKQWVAPESNNAENYDLPIPTPKFSKCDETLPTDYDILPNNEIWGVTPPAPRFLTLPVW
jgi:hypothetical protein